MGLQVFLRAGILLTAVAFFILPFSVSGQIRYSLPAPSEFTAAGFEVFTECKCPNIFG
jgi:hypothetical protein